MSLKCKLAVQEMECFRWTADADPNTVQDFLGDDMLVAHVLDMDQYMLFWIYEDEAVHIEEDDMFVRIAGELEVYPAEDFEEWFKLV